MQQNPLFPSSNSASDGSQIPDYLRTSSTTPRAPAGGTQNIAPDDREAAANLIRQKVAALYANEPSAKQELQEISAAPRQLSKHQRFMQGLQASGRSLAEIQTAWHEYYRELSDAEKHEVWQEFYAASPGASTGAFSQAAVPTAAQASPAPAAEQAPQLAAAAAVAIVTPTEPHPRPALQPRQELEKYQPVTVTIDEQAYQPVRPKPETPTKSAAPRPTIADIKSRIRGSVSKAALPKKSYFQSLGFGLACGAVVVVIFLFGFFNEVIISPFIQPSRQAIDTPVIVDTAKAAVGSTPEVIIPKINVEIPVDYSQTTTSEAAIETALDNGVVHYPTTVMPGQTGNAAFFGHSSNNIFNPGKYKFAFVLLHKLTEGDTFYLTYQGKAYVYEVISTRIVEPTEVSVLGPVEGQTATATLITCDPPGTSLHRLVVVGKQISPDPSGNTAPGTAPPALTATATSSTGNLPGNGQTLLGRLWDAIF